MPGMSGPDLARAEARLRPTLRVLDISGDESEPDEAFEDPDVAFIGKPFSPTKPVSKVRDVLDTEEYGPTLGAVRPRTETLRERACECLLGVGGVRGAPDCEHVVERFEEEVEQSCVELLAVLLLHHLAGLVRLESRAVDAIGGERVEDVGDGGDAALDRDRRPRRGRPDSRCRRSAHGA